MIIPSIRQIVLSLSLLVLFSSTLAQETATPNGIADNRSEALALTGATLYLPDGQYLDNGTLLIRDGLIVDVLPLSLIHI